MRRALGVDALPGLARQRFDVLQPTCLPITRELVVSPAHLPRHHSGPFDRILVARALEESVPILTSDRTLTMYGVAGNLAMALWFLPKSYPLQSARPSN